MRAATVLASAILTLAAACGGGAPGARGQGAATAGSTIELGGESIVIRMSLVTAAVEGAEVPATGTILDGSTLGSAPFCVGGSVEDRHAEPDASPPRFLDRIMTCPEGTVTLGLTPEVGLTPEPPKDRPQGGSWIVVGGTGAFEGLRGSGDMEGTYDPANEPGKESLSQATLTGTVTH